MKLLLSIAPTLLAALVCLNSLHGLLVFDDEAIVRNMDVRPGCALRRPVAPRPPGRHRLLHEQPSYRPLTVASFQWNVGLHGVEYVEGFHGVNVVLHALAGALPPPLPAPPAPRQRARRADLLRSRHSSNSASLTARVSFAASRRG